MSDPKQGPTSSDAILVQSDPAERARAWRTIGLWLFFGFDAGFLGYLFTGIAWCLSLPPIAFVIAWRIAYERWPFFGLRE